MVPSSASKRHMRTSEEHQKPTRLKELFFAYRRFELGPYLAGAEVSLVVVSMVSFFGRSTRQVNFSA